MQVDLGVQFGVGVLVVGLRPPLRFVRVGRALALARRCLLLEILQVRRGGFAVGRGIVDLWLGGETVGIEIERV
jgi:hypothetical protein